MFATVAGAWHDLTKANLIDIDGDKIKGAQHRAKEIREMILPGDEFKALQKIARDKKNPRIYLSSRTSIRTPETNQAIQVRYAGDTGQFGITYFSSASDEHNQIAGLRPMFGLVGKLTGNYAYVISQAYARDNPACYANLPTQWNDICTMTGHTEFLRQARYHAAQQADAKGAPTQAHTQYRLSIRHN